VDRLLWAMRNPERARGTGTMAPTSTSVDGLETVETRNYTISRAPQARRRCAGRRENGGQLRWTMAPRENPSAEHRSVQRSLRLARASRAHGSWLVRPAEPPDADPHVRSCGRGEWVTTPPMPINEVGKARKLRLVRRNHGRRWITTESKSKPKKYRQGRDEGAYRIEQRIPW